MRAAAKMHYALRPRAPRPAYLDYPYTSPEPAFTFWDDHKHQIWSLIIAAVLFICGTALYEDLRHFTLFDTLC